MKIFKYSLLAIYILFVIFVTTLLLTFNRFSNSIINNHTIAGVKSQFSNYKVGDLLIIKNSSNIEKNDIIIFYDTNNRKNFINEERVLNVIKTNETETTYVIRDNEYLSGEYVISTTQNIKSIPLLGYLYLLTTSKIGYLLFVIIPIVVYFIILLKRSGYVKKKL